MKMSEDDLQPNWDWVTARLGCSPSKFLERLRIGAEGNVKTRNDSLTPAEHARGRLDIRSHGDQFQFVVFRTGQPGLEVVFWADGQEIHVKGAASSRDVTFTGTPTLAKNGRCKLKVNDDELDEWQVLSKALELLFFKVI